MNMQKVAVMHGKKVIFVAAIAVAVASLFVSSRFETVARAGDIEYGVLYSCPSMNNYSFKVLSCDGGGWCQVFIVNEASPHGGNVTGQGKSSILALIKNNSCTTPGGETAAPNDPPPAKPVGETPPDAKDEAGGGGSCASDAAITAVPKASDSMELKSKRAILARFQQAVDKGDKVGVGITFDSFMIGAPRSNIRGVNYYEDAPAGAKIYSIKSKFTLCSTFSTEITKDVTDGRYECFNDKFGEWICGTATGYRIIKTTYEKITKGDN